MRAYKAAEKVNAISMDYQLSHAMVACEVLLQRELRENASEKISKLKEQVRLAAKLGDSASENELRGELLRLQQKGRFRIYVDYLVHSEEQSARTVCIDNELIIYLPKCVLDKTRDGKGKYTGSVVSLRKLMAHELGHAVLHTNNILKTGKTGTGTISSPGSPEENEANWFAEKLLELRHDRNKRMQKDGTLTEYF